jgi:hypothetical protein
MEASARRSATELSSFIRKVTGTPEDFKALATARDLMTCPIPMELPPSVQNVTPSSISSSPPFLLLFQKPISPLKA